MDLFLSAALPRIRRITPEDWKSFRKLSWNPHELVQLKLMDRDQLMGLMMFCDIITHNDIPVIACTDDELRMSYLIWRGTLSKTERIRVTNLLEKWKRKVFRSFEGMVWWLNQL